MEPEAGLAIPPSQNQTSRLNLVFFNERGLRAGWRFLIFSGMFAVVWALARAMIYFAGAMANRPLAETKSQTVILPSFALFGEIISFLVVLFFTWIMSRIERRKMGVYGLPLDKTLFSWFLIGYVFWGFLPLTLLLVAMRALGVFYFGNIVLSRPDIVRYGFVWFVVFLFVGLTEEYLTRGYALYTLADGIGFWPAAILMAALFGLGHISNQGETRIGILDVCLFAAFATVTLRQTGNLWLAVGAHAGWDWGQSFFYGVNDSGAPAIGHLFGSHAQGPDWLSGGTVGPEGSVLSSALLVLMTVAFLVVYRKRHEPI